MVKSKRAIRDAFISLMGRMEYSKITVSAIAREAVINRNTFYAHYESIDDLLASMCREKITQICNDIAEGLEDGLGRDGLGRDGLEALTLELLRALDEQLEIEANVVRNIDFIVLVDMLLNPLEDIMRATLRRQGFEDSERLRCYIACYVGSLLTAYTDWRRRSPHEPIEQLAEPIYRLAAAAAGEMLQLR